MKRLLRDDSDNDGLDLNARDEFFVQVMIFVAGLILGFIIITSGI